MGQFPEIDNRMDKVSGDKKEMEASKTKLFSKDDLKKLIIPLLFEQALAITVGMADTVMISLGGRSGGLRRIPDRHVQ